MDINESAYVAALSTVLKHTLDTKDTQSAAPLLLFDPEVQDIFATCQALLLDDYPAIYVLSRFLQRKAGWILSRSFLKYFDSYYFLRDTVRRAGGKVGHINGVVGESIELPDTVDIQKIVSEAMRNLQRSGLLDILYETGNSSSINVKESLTAVGQTLTNVELKQLLKKMHSFPSAGTGKSDLMAQLKHCCQHTRTIYGGSISDRLPSLVQSILNGKTNTDVAMQGYIVRVCPRVGRSLRRLQRLLQVCICVRLKCLTALLRAARVGLTKNSNSYTHTSFPTHTTGGVSSSVSRVRLYGRH